VPRIVVVTGASGGIGRATAVAFGARGDTVALIARGDEGLAGAARDVEAAGGTALIIPLDVADSDAVFAAAQRVETELGPIDVWVNVAFTSVFAPFVQIEPAEYKRVTEVSYLGYVYGTMAALKYMKPRNHGTIVQVGSALAYRGIPLQTAYCGAKHAIQGFNEALRCELLNDKSGVHVTMVQMPAVNTPQFSWVLSRLPDQAQPVPPIYQPEFAARGVLYAADHPHRREYWVGASTMFTLAANAIAPGLLDRYLGRTGVKSQQTPNPPKPDAPVNLWQPADGTDGHDFGAHGIFDARAHTRDPATESQFPPHVLREYALLADGERGAVVGPRGDIVWLCAPRWDSAAVFAALIGGQGMYTITPEDRFVWGGYYEDDSMIWRNKWTTSSGIVECRDALAYPADSHRVILLRQVRAADGDADVTERR
jgi:NAD(P)-dependent dehydrogenase (short-subunit alcohol dehydrogenase family)